MAQDPKIDTAVLRDLKTQIFDLLDAEGYLQDDPVYMTHLIIALLLLAADIVVSISSLGIDPDVSADEGVKIFTNAFQWGVQDALEQYKERMLQEQAGKFDA